MAYICFCVSIIILAVSTAFAIKNKYNMSKWFSCFLLGVFFSSFFFVLPTEWVKEGKEVFNTPVYTVLSSFLYSFKTLGGRQDIAQLETIGLNGALKIIYFVLNYINFAIAPILASSLILSFIGDTGERIRLVFKNKKNCSIFSHLNENSLAIAQGITNSNKKQALVFCNCEKTDKSLIEKAKSLGAITLHKACDNVKISKNCENAEFYIISSKEEENIKLTQSVITKNNKKTKTVINAFIESGTNTNLLESSIKGLDNGENLELRCIDETALLCNYLIYKNPLFKTDKDTISVAIVGCGKMGIRMLKTVYWAGQIDGYKLKIRVYDKAASKISEEFYKQCPGIEPNKTIKFVNADINCSTFCNELLKEENSLDATYIVISTKEDSENISLADYLYGAFRKQRNYSEDMPQIFARIRSKEKSVAFFSNADFLKQRNIVLFGTTEELYKNCTLFNSELENLAFAVHLCYNSILNYNENSDDYKNAYKSFKIGEYERRSSMATALHIPAKIHTIEREVKDGDFKENTELCERLYKNEHDRWNAFMLSEGYIGATKEEMMLIGERLGTHKDELAKVHPCITTWDELDELENAFNTTFNKQKTFKKYDIDIVDNVYNIKEVANKMNGES